MAAVQITGSKLRQKAQGYGRVVEHRMAPDELSSSGGAAS